MVDDDVLLPDRREAVAAGLADALGEARVVGLELEVGPVESDELRELVQGQHALDDEDARPAAISSSSATKWRRSSGIAGLDLEADHGAAAALLERRLEEAHEVLGLFLDLDVRVADDPEAALALARCSRGRDAR